MAWTYDVKALAGNEGQRILACLATGNKDSRQMIIAHVKQGKLKSRGLDLTDKCYAWKLAEDFAPFDSPTPKPKEVFKDVSYGEDAYKPAKERVVPWIDRIPDHVDVRTHSVAANYGLLTRQECVDLTDQMCTGLGNLEGYVPRLICALIDPSVYVEPNDGWTTGK